MSMVGALLGSVDTACPEQAVARAREASNPTELGMAAGVCEARAGLHRRRFPLSRRGRADPGRISGVACHEWNSARCFASLRRALVVCLVHFSRVRLGFDANVRLGRLIQVQETCLTVFSDSHEALILYNAT